MDEKMVKKYKVVSNQHKNLSLKELERHFWKCLDSFISAEMSKVVEFYRNAFAFLWDISLGNLQTASTHFVTFSALSMETSG